MLDVVDENVFEIMTLVNLWYLFDIGTYLQDLKP